jgi:hypothetical protein
MTSPSPALLELMSKVIDGDASYDDLLSQLEAVQPPKSDAEPAQVPIDLVGQLSGAMVDLGRGSRCGFGEVIYGEGKSAELVAQIIQTQLNIGQSALVTRIDSGVAFQVRQSFSFAYHNPLAGTLRVASREVSVAQPLTAEDAKTTFHAAVVTAGSTDAKIAEEAIETLIWMGVPYQRFDDIGVAGPQRLANALPRLRLASAVVVVAGMEGALPAVVAGHLAAPVFAVPTSIGYGASLGGLTPLMGMLSSCAASVAVVNIDGGFKGGYMAGIVVRQLQQHCQKIGQDQDE